MTNPVSQPVALGPFIKSADNGSPFLQGYRCTACRAVVLDHRRGCPQCARIGTLEICRLSETGTVFSFTIVHRSFPGIKVPFISAVVALEGGGFIKGNLEEVSPVPEAVPPNMSVEVKFEQRPSPAQPAITVLRYVFVPRSNGHG